MTLSLIAFPFDKKQALKYAFKCSLWQEEFDLLFAHKHLKGYTKDKKKFQKLFKGNRFMLSHLETAINYRRNFKNLKISNQECWNFIQSTRRFIEISNKAM
jgi:hypothetical protein